jgi:hypothetical protein
MVAMDFSVNARSVGGLADALDRRAHDLTSAASYLQAQSALKFGAGLVNELLQVHERVMATVDTFLRHASDDYAERYSTGVAQAVRAYTTVDASANARIDATLPGVIDPSVPAHLADQSIGPEIFADGEPLVLQPPPDYEAQYPYQPGWYDLMSPASIPRDAVWYVTGFLHKLGLYPEQCDPYQTFTRPLCGDWAGLERVSFALTSVARALSYVSAHVEAEANTLDKVWTGHAAGNCRSALLRFAHDLHPAVDIVVQIAAEYHQVAEASRENGKALATIVTALVDIVGSFGVEFGVEMTVDALADMRKVEEVAEALYDLIKFGKTFIEALGAVIHGSHLHLTELCTQLGLLTARPLSVNLPDDMPALPQPARAGAR